MSHLDISTPSGFPEFTPSQEIIRTQWIDIIAEIFRQHGFSPIITPLVEREKNLTGKGGNPKEIYALKRLLDDPDDQTHSGNALRFDHTVPLALYVARHLQDISFPFLRYAIGPVFRGERPQKGRFRQFDQCDIDVVGNGELSLAYDAQMPLIIAEIFGKLLPKETIKIRINNRKILTGLLVSIGVEEKNTKAVLDIIDAREKMGEKATKKALETMNIAASDQEKLQQVFSTDGSAKTPEMIKKWSDNKVFLTGIEELKTVFDFFTAEKNENFQAVEFVVDFSIARGLDYYTGTVFETHLVGYESLGSICSGGRYDDLASLFTKKKLPGVGISIGFTRLLSQLFSVGIVQPEAKNIAEILVIPAEEKNTIDAMKLAQALRKQDKKTAVYLENKKIGKAIEYADKSGIRSVIVYGDREIEAGVYEIKNMKTGEKVPQKLSK